MDEQYIFPIYKPSGPTSFDIIRQLRKITGIKKIGHAGTLDPLAEGMLVVGITRQGTKQLNQLIKKDKVYLAEIILGATSDTHDAQGKIEKNKVETRPDQNQVEQALVEFKGHFQQVPPKYSAVKINGTPAYKLARRGKDFQLEAKDVVIHEIKLLKFDYPILEILVHTGSGVYIRSLARDLGKKLNTGAYLSALKRTKVGEFEIADALTLEKFEKQWRQNQKS